MKLSLASGKENGLTNEQRSILIDWYYFASSKTIPEAILDPDGFQHQELYQAFYSESYKEWSVVEIIKIEEILIDFMTKEQLSFKSDGKIINPILSEVW